jgi:hypothetical protein
VRQDVSALELFCDELVELIGIGGVMDVDPGAAQAEGGQAGTQDAEVGHRLWNGDDEASTARVPERFELLAEGGVRTALEARDEEEVDDPHEIGALQAASGDGASGFHELVVELPFEDRDDGLAVGAELGLLRATGRRVDRLKGRHRLRRCGSPR